MLPPIIDDENGGDIQMFGWTRVVFADDLDLCKCGCDIPFCHKHNKHFADCECIGPSQDDMYYKFIQDIMVARKKPKPPPDFPDAENPPNLNFFRII